jgi:uncharacterized protein
MNRLSRILAYPLLALVVTYQWTIARLLPPACRFEPTCSWYAREALLKHGAFRGTWLAVHRLSRCRPRGGFGYDPVPD